MKLDDETLSPLEKTELVSITNAIESANALRMRNLVELAEVRQVSLDQLMDQLGLGNGREPGSESPGG